MKRLIFITLALVILLTVPVSAYTVEDSWTWTGGNGNEFSYYGGNTIWVSSWANYLDHPITKIEMDATLTAYGTCAASGVTNSTLSTSGVMRGNVSISWSHTGTAWHVEFNILDLNFSGDPFAQGLSLSWGALQTCQLDGPFGPRTETDTHNIGAIYFGSANRYMAGDYTTYTGPAVEPPTAAFSCTPTSQFPDEPVVCTDTSAGGDAAPTSWLWTIDAEALGIKGWQTNTSQNFTWQSAYSGLYSVNLYVNNSAGNDWENKTNYVSISENATPNNCNIPPLTGYSRTSFQCTDAISSGKINGCDIQLHDLEGGAWSNMTNTDGTWCIDTLPAHHINGYGQSTGYTDGSRLNVQEWNGQTYTILMIPGYVPPPATGYVWVYVHVTEFATATDLSGVTVSIQGTGLSTVSGVTDNSGVVHLQWPNATEAYINSAKPGYSTAMDVITTSDFGPDTVHVELHRGVHTMTIVPTTGPGGTVPTTAGPWGTPGPYGTMPSGYTNSQGQLAMDYLAANGLMLVQLCVFVTIAALLGFKFGK